MPARERFRKGFEHCSITAREPDSLVFRLPLLAEIAVTLAESQGKKAAFLREAVRTLGVPVKVHGGRAERLGEQFDCVTLRAVDRMPEAVAAAAKSVGPRGWLALMTTSSDLARLKESAGTCFLWSDPNPLPGSESRLLALGRRR